MEKWDFLFFRLFLSWWVVRAWLVGRVAPPVQKTGLKLGVTRGTLPLLGTAQKLWIMGDFSPKRMESTEGVYSVMSRVLSPSQDINASQENHISETLLFIFKTEEEAPPLTANRTHLWLRASISASQSLAASTTAFLLWDGMLITSLSVSGAPKVTPFPEHQIGLGLYSWVPGSELSRSIQEPILRCLVRILAGQRW